MNRYIIRTLMTIVLILFFAVSAAGCGIIDKYTYSKERADLNEYFKLTGADDMAIVMQDGIVEEKAKYSGGSCYFSLSTVEKYFTERFYVNYNEQVLLFTTDTDVIKINIGDGSSVMYVSDVPHELGYKAAFYEGDVLYIAADYVQKYADFEYYMYDAPLRLQVYTQWGTYDSAVISKKTALRYQGGIKSDILIDLAAGDNVTVIEKMENWSKVKSENAVIGYVENKFLKNERQAERICATGFVPITYANVKKDGTINLVFHQIFNETDGNKLAEAIIPTKSVNVVSPTWFRLSDSSGNFTSLANASYVSKAHELGIDVWALITDVDSEDLYGVTIDFNSLLSSSANRKTLIEGLMAQVDAFGIDGINIDFEKVKKDSGIHFVQFLRELSIETRKRGVVLSVDNYVPSEYTEHYNRKEQGIVCDYLIIMGYDEYYSGVGEAGPNASINFVENGIEDTKRSVPAEKIINAIPFYTRVWGTGPDGAKASTLIMSAEASWINQSGVAPVWLDEYCQNYVEYQSGDTLYQCWLEDLESVRVKLQVMKVQGIKGVAAWKLGLEDAAVWDVIEEYVNG